MAQDRMRAGKRARLEAEITAARLAAYGRPFVWGQDDCCLWPANIIRAALGYDPAAAWRGRYTTPRGAYRVMHERNLAKTIALAAIEHNWLDIAPAGARTGDIGVALLPDDRAACVIRFRSVWIGRTDRGVAVLTGADKSKVELAWRV